jgi:hypothetical protein
MSLNTSEERTLKGLSHQARGGEQGVSASHRGIEHAELEDLCGLRVERITQALKKRAKGG